MATRRSSKAGPAVGADTVRHVGPTAGRFIGPKTGSAVKVTFGRREVQGIVVGRTITGRYSVKVDVPGADSPVTTTYAADELRAVS
ncbi:hypothetical protein BKD30_14810 [Tersicoccus phoenicis]|uniref:DUF1918 domain-containing protein n=1 Tax=Tersicoccus phoenicis TaxID=554083 RepID=A0A1R1L6H2_9MICC|nr:hypothetical protein BKD30_14810 [Tersicoccus phoenicis]